MDIRIPGMPFPRKKEAKEGGVERGKAPSAGKGERKAAVAHPTAKSASASPEIEALRRKIAVYRRIIERYREMIEKSETKTLTELRSLVKPKDAAVLKIRDEITDEFRPYFYDRHFGKAAEKAYHYVREKIASEELPVDFWLTTEDMLELKVADEMDKGVLLCSLLRSMECEDAKVVVSSDGERHVFVGHSFGGRYVLVDPTHGVVATGEREEVLRSRFSGRGATVYEFNDKEYDEIIGGE